ncbi:fimbrillin family protein [Parasphaerochaeta coccoides]|uniref:GLUG domain-containing protein n=1 Tax=Parasphaerochaeta coccoides (strain ATCC BAA-1237 / DSM 17374 / SPN1) TaxID=760011 RepID=F4GLS7_PARC1|nr:fimbrillin family protein [Parasphaerochaeta coccoides]AEC02471.1 hypothetical protein Spico_1262 [Parasphaerochaeta coccoides DSM 17374]
MKNKSLVAILLLMLAAVSLVSCVQELDQIYDVTDDEGRQGADGQVMLFSGGMNALNLETGDSLGFFMVGNGNALTPSNILDGTDNLRLTYDELTGEASFDSGIVVYYPNNGSLVDFISYAPYAPSLASYALPMDVTDQSNPNLLDIFYVRKNNMAKQSSPVVLTFQHMMSKMTLTVNVNDAGILDPDTIDEITVTTVGWPTTAVFRVDTGTFTSKEGATEAISFTMAANGINAVSQDMIFIPHSEGEFPDRSLGFTVRDGASEKNYTWNVPASWSFDSGQHYILDITIRDRTIVVETVTIEKWEVGGTGNADTADILDYTGDGSVSNPYKIYTARGLAVVLTSANSSKNFILMRNIELGTYLGSTTWTPFDFSGTLDGNGYAIDGVTVTGPGNAATGDKLGFFKTITSGAVVKNIGLTNVSVTGRDNLGGLAGVNNNGTITNCYVSGAISGEDVIGGIIGQNNGTITGSTSYVRIKATGNSSGGVAGQHLSGVIENSSAIVTLNGSDIVGGLVGKNSASITGSSAAGTVSGGQYVGGLVGQNDSGKTISNSYVRMSSVTGTSSHVGGFVGRNQGTVTNSDTTRASIVYSVQGQNTVGGFVGANTGTESSITKAIVYYGKVSGTGTTSISTGTGGFAGHQTATITDSKAIGMDASALVTANGRVGGFVGTNTGAIERSHAETNGNITGTADNSVGGFVGYTTGNISNSSATVQGFISGANDYVGGFGGYISASMTGNSAFTGGNILGAANWVGGFAGALHGPVSYSHSRTMGKISGGGAYSVGGFIGHSAADVSNCFSEASTVTGTAYIGGFIGYKASSTVKESYALVNSVVSITDRAGGFVGYHVAGSITDSYVIVNNAVSALGGAGAWAGGFAGMNSASVSYSYAVVNGSVTGLRNIGGFASTSLARDIKNSFTVVQQVTAINGAVSRLIGDTAVTSTTNRAYTSVASISGNSETTVHLDLQKDASWFKGATNFSVSANWTGGVWDASIWDFPAGKYPILKNVAGGEYQDGYSTP